MKETYKIKEVTIIPQVGRKEPKVRSKWKLKLMQFFGFTIHYDTFYYHTLYVKIDWFTGKGPQIGDDVELLGYTWRIVNINLKGFQIVNHYPIQLLKQKDLLDKEFTIIGRHYRD